MKRIGLALLLSSLSVFADGDDVWSIAQIGDIHAPLASQASIATNWAPFVIAHTNDGVFNFRVVISAGDIYQQDDSTVPTDPYTLHLLTNDLNLVKSAGLKVILSNGNHDCDYVNFTGNTNGFPVVSTCNGYALRAGDTNRLWNKIFPLSFFTNQVGFITNFVAGESEAIAFAYTNGPTKLLFVTYKTLGTNCNPSVDYAAQTTWLTNLGTIYSDHQIIAMAHFFMNGYGELRYTDGPAAGSGFFNPPLEQGIGPGRQPLDGGILALSNILFLIAGHDRAARKQHKFIRANDGHFADIILWNTQTGGNNCGYVNVYTFKKRLGLVEINTYDITSGRFLTNNDTEMRDSINTSFPHHWVTPFSIPKQYRVFKMAPQ